MSQRRALGVLFLVLALGLAFVAFAALRDGPLPVAFGAGVLAAWLATMAVRGLSG